MHRSHLWLAIVPVAVGGIGCHKDSTQPVHPVSLQISGGDNQSALAGAPLQTPLQVTVMGSDGSPYRGGVTINWQVVAGAGSVSPTTSSSDGNGNAATTLTLGTTPGPNAVSASGRALSTVTLHATGLDPCSLATSYSIGATANGQLASLDCVVAGAYTDFYTLNTTSAQPVELTLSSLGFDTFLALLTNDRPVAFNDDVGSSTNSRIKVLLGFGSYILAATSFSPGEIGSYTLGSSLVTQDVGNCDEVWATRSIVTAQQITPTDCLAGGPSYYDEFSIYLNAGDAVTTTESSTDFDAYLCLEDAARNVLQCDDDSGGGTNARLVRLIAATGRYYIVAWTFFTNESGAYTLAIN